jgi:chromosome segregation ATPase
MTNLSHATVHHRSEPLEDAAPDFGRLTSSTRLLGSMIEMHEAKLGSERPSNPDSRQLSAALDQIRRASSLLGSLEDRSSDLQASYDELAARSEREREEAEARLEASEARAEQALERARVAEQRLREAEDRLRQLAAVIEEELGPCLRR